MKTKATASLLLAATIAATLLTACARTHGQRVDDRGGRRDYRDDRRDYRQDDRHERRENRW